MCIHKYYRLFLKTIILCACVILLAGVVLPLSAAVNWYDASWVYRSSITVTNNEAVDLSDYQVVVVTDTMALFAAGMMKADGSDIRFTKDDHRTVLPYWIETVDPSTATACMIWVKITGTNSLPASSAITIYMYFGNPSAPAASSGVNTFEVFDDFETDTWIPETNMGSQYTSSWTASVSVSPTHSCQWTSNGDRSIIAGYARYYKTLDVGSGSRKAKIFYREDYLNNRIRLNRFYVGSVLCEELGVQFGVDEWHTSQWADITSQTGSQQIVVGLYDTQKNAKIPMNAWWDNFMVRKFTATEPTVTPNPQWERNPYRKRVFSILY